MFGDEAHTSLSYVCGWGLVGATRELIQAAGMVITNQGAFLEEALYNASFKGHFEFVQLLLSHGANIHKKGQVTPILCILHVTTATIILSSYYCSKGPTRIRQIHVRDPPKPLLQR